MKLHIKSDLHINFKRTVTEEMSVHHPAYIHPDADVVVLAGDLCESSDLFKVVSLWGNSSKHVVYVPGNHEYYGKTIEEVNSELRRTCAGTSITPLIGDIMVIEDVLFIGATLWTPLDDPYAQMVRKSYSDFEWIKDMALEKYQRLHLNDKHLIRTALMSPLFRDKKKVVISHFLPFSKSIPERFTSNLSNSFFHAKCEDLITDLGDDIPCLWIHGHTHDSCDYVVENDQAKTRVICNPMGYENALNSNFQNDLLIEI